MKQDATPDMDQHIRVDDFFDRIVTSYNEGQAEQGLPAEFDTARSLMPPGTATKRDFSYIAPDIPIFDMEKCVGCMDCVTECPDTAILAKVTDESALPGAIDGFVNAGTGIDKAALASHFSKTTKYYDIPKKKTGEGGLFSIFIDPTKCKGCAECVEVCGSHDALKMIRKTDENRPQIQQEFDFFNELEATPEKYINEKLLGDMMLAEKTLLYTGGAGSCMGCGEATAIRMMLAATSFIHGPKNVGIVAATGCNTVYASTYPYNPYIVPWSNSLFENVATYGMGVRMKWDQMGWTEKKLWAIGGDGAMIDIGFQALSRMLASGMNISVLILDTQAYSNTNGQASTASFTGQETKMSYHGKAVPGKTERRKEIGQLAIMHPDTFVAQTTAAHTNHFYKAILAANEFDGPAIINCYTTCQPEHGVADHLAAHQARLAVDTRAFPLFVHDPRKGERLSERLSLQGNPNTNGDWYADPKTKEDLTFVDFARSEGRFAKQFDKDGNPSEILQRATHERLQNWHQLQELAGIL